MKSTKIALVDESSAMGGVEFSTLYLALCLDRKLFDPVVVCPGGGDLLRLCREHGVEACVVPRGRLFSFTTRLGGRYVPNPFAALANAITLLAGVLRLRGFLRREKVDLVCTKGLLTHVQGGLAAHLVGVPCVWHVQDRVSDRALGLYRRFVGLSATMLADHIIADGSTIIEQTPLPLRSSGKVSLVYNGVDTEEFSPDVVGRRVRQELGLGNERLVVGNVARLTRWKGQEHLLRAAALLAPEFLKVHFLLVGSPLFSDGEYERELKALADVPELRGRVTFAGYRFDLPQVLAAIDVFVYTSVEKDTSPLALLSAAAAGKPIVAPAISGIRELFTDGVDGVLVPPGDVDRLVDALRSLLTDEELRISLGQRARDLALREFSVQRFTERCQAVFSLVLSVNG